MLKNLLEYFDSDLSVKIGLLLTGLPLFSTIDEIIKFENHWLETLKPFAWLLVVALYGYRLWINNSIKRREDKRLEMSNIDMHLKLVMNAEDTLSTLKKMLNEAEAEISKIKNGEIEVSDDYFVRLVEHKAKIEKNIDIIYDKMGN